MVIFKKDEKVNVTEHLRGGDGVAAISDYYQRVHPANSASAGTHVLKEGCGIGFHEHPTEYEFYYIFQGEGEYDDNGKEKIKVGVGDLTICVPGEGHGIRNIGKEDLKFVGFKITADENNK